MGHWADWFCGLGIGWSEKMRMQIERDNISTQFFVAIIFGVLSGSLFLYMVI